MKFNYNPLKTVQAAALFLKLNKQPMEYMKLIKLLYLADRFSLKMMDDTITGDSYVSMDHGPVLSKLYDLISHGPIYDKDNPWFKYISSPQNYCVSLNADPGNDELCEDEEKIIEGVYKTFGQINVWELSKLTHLIPEWKNPYGSAISIRIEDILRELGKTEDDIKAVQEDIVKENYFDMLLAS
jgi:uncharacterized phage-associated protein